MLNRIILGRETANERARRTWNNARIISELKERRGNGGHMKVHHMPRTDGNVEYLKFKRAIRKIINMKSIKVMKHYLVSIEHKKRKLLIEKLRRLESGQ